MNLAFLSLCPVHNPGQYSWWRIIGPTTRGGLKAEEE